MNDFRHSALIISARCDIILRCRQYVDFGESHMVCQYDDRERRCPALGHQIKFSYCRTSNLGIACRKILDCWFNIFPVEKFVEESYSEEERAKIFAPPKSKMLSLLELIEQAKASAEDKS